jgi:Fe-S cluster assembly protein SufD
LFVATGGDRATATHPRNLIVIESNAQASVVESYVALADGAYFTNPVTEIVAGDNAIVRHYKVERESAQAYHIAAQQLQQLRTSSVSSHNVSIGGAIVRNDVNTRLDGEGAHCTLYGLSTIHGAQHVDNHLIVDHAQPHCDSREFYKGVYDDRSRGVFSGRIIVREGAQKTDAKQTNQTLLLSRDAQVDSKPQLEIFADDVKCTHGATIGQVSEDAVFYLRSRGVSADAARNLLVYAFAREIVATIRLDSLRATLDALLFHRLPQEAGLMEVA